MSDYMFMLESHLSADQNRVVSEVQAAAAQSERQPVPRPAAPCATCWAASASATSISPWKATL